MDRENRRNALKPAPISIVNNDVEAGREHGGARAHFAPLPEQNLHLTADDLWSMWKVATKAKSSIDQGPRLENLSWRLWHTIGTLQKSDLPAFGLQMAKTYSSILNDIQQVTCDSATAARRSPSDALQGRPEGGLGAEQGGPGILFSKAPEAATKDNQYLIRKKKKNIERFMKKNGHKRIESIDGKGGEGEGEGEGGGEGEGEDTKVLPAFDTENRQNGSVQPEPTVIHGDLDALFSRKPVEQTAAVCARFAAQTKPSLLSILLRKRQVDVPAKPDMCSFQYPSRPGAPGPPHLDQRSLTTADGPEDSDREVFMDCSS